MDDVDSLAAHVRAIEATIPLLDAMRSIAEMAFRIAQRATGPLAAYTEQVSEMLNALADTLQPASRADVFAGMMGSGPAALVLLGSERGLCGSFNERLAAHAATLRLSNTLLICWGSRVARAAQSAGQRVDVIVPLPSLRIPSYAEVQRMTLALLDFVDDRNVSRVDVVYDAPVHAFQHGIRSEQILPPAPLNSHIRRGPATEVKPADDISTLLIQLITEQVLAGLYRVVLVSAVSEQLARIAAMRLSSDNAHKLLDDLTSEYNTARQHAITQSLLAIVSGYETAAAAR